ncbi:DUF1656 domain-containing protein [Pistricoccus aurantiacus]|uniref:DUF1656 domain-containing protein n=1 Tax=Pistricoccus aurantiacus TaxID=1883414 RepID=A0A5B8T106_9GAMM|nr:DUF1656 domain-containing protein [Pistricoccus aurantiacus]QEA40738.1 DUF1656 domain-containing protein [Pistricoccus aurantiacus]
MGLQEISLGGIYLSPLLLFALLGFIATLAVRALLHYGLKRQAPWYEAWFDFSLFVILTAAVTYLFTAFAEAY